MRAILAIAALIIVQLAQAAEPVGRIFYTHEHRDQLDSLRKQRVVATQVRDEPVPEIVTLNGIVRRNDGKTTVWLNNQILSEAELRNKQSMVGTVSRNGQVTLQAPQSAVQMRLKVGQSAELLSGRVDESYSAQRTATAPQTAPAPAAKKEESRPPIAKTDAVRSAPRPDELPVRERTNDANAR